MHEQVTLLTCNISMVPELTTRIAGWYFWCVHIPTKNCKRSWWLYIYYCVVYIYKHIKRTVKYLMLFLGMILIFISCLDKICTQLLLKLLMFLQSLHKRGVVGCIQQDPHGTHQFWVHRTTILWPMSTPHTQNTNSSKTTSSAYSFLNWTMKPAKPTWSIYYDPSWFALPIITEDYISACKIGFWISINRLTGQWFPVSISSLICQIAQAVVVTKGKTKQNISISVNLQLHHPLRNLFKKQDNIFNTNYLSGNTR